MNTNQLQTIEQLMQFLDGTQSITLSIEGSKKSRYAWVRKTLVQFHYLALAKPEKGIVKQYVMKVIGCSRAQLTRLIHQYQRTGKIILRHNKNANRFKV